MQEDEDMDALSDTDLAAAMIARRQDAFESFARRNHDSLLGFARYVCGEHAEEVLQETLLKAYQSIHDLRDPAALRSWIYRIAVNECRRIRQREWRGRTIELPLEDVGEVISLSSQSELPLDALLKGELREKLEDAILSLPDAFQIVLVLRDLEGFSTQEAASILEIGEPLVRVRLHRARSAVRRSLLPYVHGQSV